MSEENNSDVLRTKTNPYIEKEKGALKEDDNPRPLLLSDKTSNEIIDVFSEKVLDEENSPPINPTQPQGKNIPLITLGDIEENVDASDSNSPKQQPISTDASTETESFEKTGDVVQSALKPTTVDTSTETKSLGKTYDLDQPDAKTNTADASTGTKSLERASDDPQPDMKSTTDESPETKSLGRTNEVDQPVVKSTASSEITPTQAPSSDKGLEGVTENVQLIYEGMKDLKLTTKEMPAPASGKKVRKAPSTPRAKSTPVLTSPPLTRSRSRDLRKFPSTPSSPKASSRIKNSEDDLDEIKNTRGRQRVKKNN